VTPCCSRRSSFRRCSRSWSPRCWPAALHGHRTRKQHFDDGSDETEAVKEIRDDAVVLRTYSQASPIGGRLWTRNYGKVRVLAKGIRKTTSRLGGNLETLAHVTWTS